MDVDLDRLEALAKAAEWADPWNDRAWEENGAFIGELDPMTVLALIAQVRADHNDAEKWRRCVERIRRFAAHLADMEAAGATTPATAPPN